MSADPAALLGALRDRGIEIALTGDDLRVRARPGTLAPEERERLRMLKPALVSLLRAEREDDGRAAGQAALSLPQERLWYLDRLEGGLAAYNLTGAFELLGPLDVERLRSALRAFAARHDALRMSVREEGGKPLAAYAVEAEFPLGVAGAEDLLGAGWTEADLERWLESEAERPLPLDRAPLVRATLVRCGEGRHVLLLLAHHVIWDGWCFDLFLEEMSSLYAADGPQASGLPPAPSYAAYAREQRLRASNGRIEREVPFWDRLLGRPAPPLDLPTDRPRPAMMTYRGGRVGVRLDGTDLAALRAAAARLGVTPFVFLLAVFETLLHRYGGQTDLVVGFPIDGRAAAGVERLVGLCVNTLVVRTEPGGDVRFSDFAHRVREGFLDVAERQDTPFEWLVQRYALRDPGRTPLFQAMFTHQHTGGRATRWGPLGVRSYPRGTRTTYTDLSLWVREYDGYLDGGLDYRTDLFDRGTVEGMAGAFEALTRAFARDPDLALEDPPLTSDEVEPAGAQDARADARAPTPGSGCYLGRVRERVEDDPDAPAVRDGAGEVRTRAQVWDAAGRVAGALRALGVEPGRVVALCVDRTVDLPALVVGIHRAGAVYLPLDPEHPPARLAHMLAAAGAALAIAGGERIPPLGAVRVVPPEDVLSGEGSAPGDVPVDADALAYLMFTSGSTGEPKAVEVEHGALASFLPAIEAVLGADASDRWIALTTVSFDISLLELLLPLWTGAEVTVADRRTAADPRALARLIEAAKTNSVQATPATWQALTAEGWEGRLRRIVCGGETLPRGLADRLLPRADVVWNVYGPTEATIWASAGRVLPGDSVVPIGRPLPNSRIDVLDGRGRRLPRGARGDLWIAGPGLARGYRGQPELTAERFPPEPTAPGGRRYRTGDLGRWRADGRLEHLGRSDEQLKVQGFRIEAGEVESALERLPEVRRAAVGLRGSEERRHLVAWAVFEPGRELVASEVRQRLADTLPRAMIPGMVLAVEEIPLNPSGKVDRARLPDPPATAGRPRGFESPRPGMEEEVASVWREVLRTQNVGRHDNFFELGGNSLQSIRAGVEIERRTGVPVDPRDFFFRTLAQLVDPSPAEST